MQVKNIVRKAAVLGSSALMLGATVGGAFAYDLSTYPAKYVVDGKFDGYIVVGSEAKTSDVLGSIDIAASLQGASVSKVPIPGQAGKVSFSGDVYEIGSGSDNLELRELISSVDETITGDDLAGLKGGKLTTPEGSTNFNQYLRLDGANFVNMAVNYVNNGEGDKVMQDYLVVERNSKDPFIEWEMQFDEGFEAEISDDATTTKAASLQDYEDRVLNIMGTDYNIVGAKVESDGGNFQMTLMGGSVPDTLREQEVKTYNINGVDYEVTLVFVSDPSSSSSGPEVKFSVNGEITQAMRAGDTDVLSGGMQIGVRDVLVNSREGVASFYLGAHKIVIDEPDVTTGDYEGDIDINDETQENNVVDVAGSVNSGTFEITSIKYKVAMKSAEGKSNVAYVPKDKGVRELMEEPELLISDQLDIKYGGLTTPDTTMVEIDSTGDDEYTMTFTNLDGKEFTFPLLTTDGTLRFGDSSDDLVFTEATASTYNIGIDDYLIISSKTGSDVDRAVTHVLQYDEYDADQNTISFTDLSGGTVTAVIDSNLQGEIKVGGHTYDVNITADADDTDIAVDLNGDGNIEATDYSVITTKGGLSLYVSSLTNSTAAAAPTATTAVGDGKNLATNGYTAVNFTAVVKGRNLDTNSDETFKFDLTEVSATELGVDFSSSSYFQSDINSTKSNDAQKLQFAEAKRNSDDDVMMTNYGILITRVDNDNDPDTLSFEVPTQQRLPQVFVTMGSVSESQGGAGMADKVNPIAVGLAVEDKDAETLGYYGKENLIIVGGPCANTIAAKFMGSTSENCAEGFEADKAMIASKEMNGKVAILVAGADAKDTVAASRVLADYKAHPELKGTEVVVSSADLKNIKVSAAQ